MRPHAPFAIFHAPPHAPAAAVSRFGHHLFFPRGAHHQLRVSFVFSFFPSKMSSAGYAPVSRGALKLKGAPQASKSHRKKKPKPEPSLLELNDSKVGDREGREDDKTERHIRSRSRDQGDQEHDDKRSEERGGGELAGEQERSRERDIDPKEQDEIPSSQGKTAAEMRHEERRKRKVGFPSPAAPLGSSVLVNFRRCARNQIFLFIPFYPAWLPTHLPFP